MGLVNDMRDTTNQVKNISAEIGDLKNNLENTHAAAVKIIEICKGYKEQNNE